MPNKQYENKTIIETLRFLEQGKYRERKPYIKDFRGDGVTLNGLTFQRDVYCWIIWKSTDIGDQPQFKGEPLYKVIPTSVYWEQMADVLNAQPWTYA